MNGTGRSSISPWRNRISRLLGRDVMVSFTTREETLKLDDGCWIYR